MLRKVIKAAIIVVSLFAVFTPATKSYALPRKVTKQKCSMKPVKVYYNALTDKKFKPTDDELIEARLLYQEIQKGDTKIYIKDNPNMYRLYGILQTEYFPYEGCRCIMQLNGDENDYFYFKILNTQRAISRNETVKIKVKSVIRSLKITKKTSQVNAIKKINKWICKNMSYDNQRAAARFSNDYDDADYTPSIISKKGICGDYARTFTFLANYCGINSGCVINEDVSHEYNLVKIAGKTYYIDVCYNDGSKTTGYSFLSKKKLKKVGHTIGEVIWYGGNAYYNTASCYE